jgi:transposase
MNVNDQTCPSAAFIGLDWADQKHQFCLWTREQGMEKPVELLHTPEALQEWIAGLRQRFGNQKIALCLEQSRGSLIYALFQTEFLVLFPINPKSLARYREALSPSRAKDDPRDARYLCQLVRDHFGDLRAMEPEDPQTRALIRLVENRRGLVDQRTASVQQIGTELKSYYPQALEMMGDDVASVMALSFLKKWPTWAALKKAPAHSLRKFYYAMNCRSEENIQKRLELAARSVPLTEDEGVVRPAQMLVLALVAQIEPLQEHIRLVEEEIQKRFQAHPDAFIFKGLPGAGPAFAPRLLAAFGSRRERFASASALQSYSGIAPIVISSGKSKAVYFRTAAPKFYRQTFHEFAKYSLLTCAWAKALYQQLINRGKSHQAAVRAVAFKWQRILWKMWQERKPYDEALYLQVLEKRGSPYAKAAPIAKQTV